MIAVSLGEGVELRPLLPRHASELASCVEGARDHLAPWTMLAARVTDERSARELLDYYDDPSRYFGIWRGDRLSGGALFRSINVDEGVCEIGGWLIPEAEGHGLITDAFRHLITHAFEALTLDRVELYTSTENKRLRRIAERLGMRLTAVRPASFVTAFTTVPRFGR